VVSTAGDRAAIARGNDVEVYELPGGRLLRTVTHRSSVNALAFSPVGHDLVSGAVDGSLLVTRDGYDPLPLPVAGGGIDAAAFLADGRVVAADAHRRLRVIDVEHNNVLADLTVKNRVRLLRPAPEGPRLLTLSSGAKQAPPELWDLSLYRLVAHLEGHGRVFAARFVNHGGEILTSGGDGAVRLWDGVAGQLRRTYRGGSRFLADAALSSDGSLLVAGGGDGLLRFWDVASGRQVWTLQAHRSHVLGLHFEGEDLITRGFSGDVTRWAVPAAESVIQACFVASCDIIRK